MGMIDSHCHLDLPIFDTDRDAVLERSRRAGIAEWVVPGIVLADFSRLAALQSETIHIALGLHPWFMADHPADAVEQLKKWLDRTRVVAIGEIGLDFAAPKETHAAQQTLFKAQLHLARERHLPVLLHVRKAHEAVLSLLREMALPAGGIVHAYSGSREQARSYLSLGFRLGFGGSVTRAGAKRVRQVAASIPDLALVLESDAPDLPPAGHDGARNEPAHVALTAQTLAELRGVPLERIAAITTANTRTLFRLPAVSP